MIVQELFAALGLDVDETKIAKGMLATEALKQSVQAIGQAVRWATREFVESIKFTAEYGDRVDEVADKAGVSRKTLQELSYAGSFAGVGMDDLAQAMNYMAKRGVKDVTKEFGDFADKIKAIGPGEEASRLAIERFGRSGAALIPMLKGGRKAMEDLITVGRESGNILSDDEIERAAKLADSFDFVGKAVEALRLTIGVQLLDDIKELADSVTQWIKDNRKDIAEGVGWAFRFFKGVFGFIAQLLSPVGKLLSWLAFGTKAWMAILVGVTGYMAGAFALSLSMAIAKWVGLGAVADLAGKKMTLAAILPLLPWILFGGLILLIAEDIYEAFAGGESIFGEAGKSLMRLWDGIKNVWKWEIKPAILEVWDAIIAAIKEKLASAWAWTRDTAKSMLPTWLGGSPGPVSAPVNTSPGGLFGGGGASSPWAAAMQSPNASGAPILAPNFNAGFTINATPNQDAGDVAGETRRMMEEFYQTKMRQAKAGVSQ